MAFPRAIRRGALALWAGLLALAAPAAAQTTDEFTAWRDSFRAEALEAGISAATFDAAFEGVAVSAQVLERDAFQPEFTRAIWEYLDSAVSDARIAGGQVQLAENAELFDRIEERFNVDRHVVAAIWGLESSYGAIRGTTYIIEALATLAFDGRRRAWAEEQLVAALRLLDEGNMEPRAMVGSWAGAMGHTQFIPTSYIQYAVDFDGDGRRDLINTPADALASAANYLARHGWDAERPWGAEVMLPEDFSFEASGRGNDRALSEWRAMGVILADGAPLPNTDERASIIVPGGAAGPAFLIRDNFGVIMRYNNSTAYALGISHLSDRLRGEESFVGTWPRDARPLTRTERMDMQRLLAERGYDPGPVDGIIGARTQAAVRGFQRDQGLPADGFASAVLLEQLRAAN
jgi:membrane-bound lytic murein transglycosylase B